MRITVIVALCFAILAGVGYASAAEDNNPPCQGQSTNTQKSQCSGVYNCN
jgi:hypothetical protein